ncbi:MAG: O-antigen ligase family protein [Eubacteriales bacterium]|nr:O-antigen ligase family protein [Eubacteriales bacterium]
MTKSKIILFVISLWKMLVLWYEASFVAGAIDKFCNFFINNADGSFVVRLFRHGAFGGEWWKNSIAYKTMCAFLSGRESNTEKKRSNLIDALLNFYNIPLRYIGAVIASYAVALFASILAFDNTATLNIIIAAALVVVAVVAVMFNKSCYSLYLGSRLLRLLGDLIYDGEYVEPQDRKISCRMVSVIAVVLGIAAGATSPLAVTAAICAILFVAVVISRFEAGVFAILFLAAFLPTAVVAGLGVLTALGFVYALLNGRVRNLKPTAIAPLLAIYVLLGLCSTATSFDLFSSAFVFLVYLVFIVTYVVMVNTLTTRNRWYAAVATFAIGTFLISLFGIVQNFTMDATTQSWVDSNMFSDIKIRVYATFDNPNVLGQYFIITIPLIFSLFVVAKKAVSKTIWLGIFTAGFLCLLFTWSRGAWVGVVLGIGIFLLIRDRRWIVLGVLAVLVLPFILPDSIMNRLLSIGNTNDSSTAYRVSVWVASARMALEYWMLGVGYGSDAFAKVYSTYALNGAGYALHAHNFYIQLVVDVGIGGFITYLLIVLTAYKEISTVKNNYVIKTISLAFVGILAGYMFQGVAESLWYNMRMSLMFWIVMAFVMSGAKLDKEEQSI